MQTRVVQLSFLSVPTVPVQALDPRAVLNPVRAATKRDNAIERVDKHADSDWKVLALETVKAVAQRFAEFSTDLVLAELANSPIRTHELRALGPVMLSARRAGYIEPTDRFENSNSVTRHKAPKRIWKSQLYRRQET